MAVGSVMTVAGRNRACYNAGMMRRDVQAGPGTQLTVRGLPPELATRLKQEARVRGWSLNHTVLFLLRQATGLEKSGPQMHTDLDHVLGAWTEDETRSFDRALEEMRTIDSEVWT